MTTEDKSWALKSDNPIRSKIAIHWTIAATECYLQEKCLDCVYHQYCCQKTIKNTYIMRLVVRELISKFGEPPKDLIDKVKNGDYN